MHAAQLYSHFEWEVPPLEPYSIGLCYAVHALLLFDIWMFPIQTTLGEVLRCSPPQEKGGDPGLFFRRCVDLDTQSFLQPQPEDLYQMLLQGPVLVGTRNHALTLKGFNPHEWLLVDTEPIALPRNYTFDYALGI